MELPNIKWIISVMFLSTTNSVRVEYVYQMRLQKMRRFHFWFFLVTVDAIAVRYTSFDPISRRRRSFDDRALPY